MIERQSVPKLLVLTLVVWLSSNWLKIRLLSE